MDPDDPSDLDELPSAAETLYVSDDLPTLLDLKPVPPPPEAYPDSTWDDETQEDVVFELV